MPMLQQNHVPHATYEPDSALGASACELCTISEHPTCRQNKAGMDIFSRRGADLPNLHEQHFGPPECPLWFQESTSEWCRHLSTQQQPRGTCAQWWILAITLNVVSTASYAITLNLCSNPEPNPCNNPEPSKYINVAKYFCSAGARNRCKPVMWAGHRGEHGHQLPPLPNH